MLAEELARLGGIIVGMKRSDSLLRIEDSRGMILIGHSLGEGIAAPLFRYHMHDTAGVLALRFLQNDVHFFEIVSVNGAEIDEPQIFEYIVVYEKSLC